MNRRGIIIALLAGAPLVLLGSWIGNRTYWEDIKVPMPPKGEALTNPFYAVQRFALALGARASWDRVFVVPPSNAVVVLSGWHWSLSRARRQAIERWVESGGRLVVDDMLIDIEDEFADWSGISRDFRNLDEVKERTRQREENECVSFQEELDGKPSPAQDTFLLCDLAVMISSLKSEKTASWALHDASGIQAMRVDVGRGTVTVINDAPFRKRRLFDGDHGRLFVAAAQLRRGDEVHFVSEDDYPSLLALVWQHGAAVVVLALSLVALALWRGALRFGPLAPAPQRARRSLAEQIRGTGQFALRHGSGQALHAALVRALDEAAQRRVKSYAGMAADQRISVLAGLTGFDREALAAAIHHPGLRSAHELRRTIALLEAARRQTLIEHTRSSHGTR